MGNVKWNLGSFSIKQKLLGGFGLMILITGIAAGTGWWSAHKASGNTSAVLKIDMPLLKRANRALADLRSARIEENAFLLHNELKHFEKAKGHINVVKEELDAILQALSDQQSRTQVEAAVGLIGQYGASFEKLVSLRTQRGLTPKEGLEGRLRSSVHDVEQVVTEKGLAELTVLMLMCRRHEKDYLLRGDEKYLGEIAQRIVEFRNQMEMFGMAGDDKEKLNGLFQTYYKGMESIVAIDKEINGAVAIMNQVSEEMETKVSAFTEAAHQSIDQNGEAVLSGLGASRSFLVVLLICAVVFSVFLGLSITRSVTKPISGLVLRLKEIAQGGGDLTTRLEVNSKDEIGELAGAFNVFVAKLQEIMKAVAGKAMNLRESAKDLSTLSEQMSQGTTTMSSHATSVSGASEEMSANMTSVAGAMEQTSTNIGIVATSAEEMTSTINEIAQNSEKGRVVTEDAVKRARDASEKVGQLGKAAQEIGAVTQTITDISDQTNLLALNATIEAARAGEAGKGFAVVANEIKELAKQTAGATRDIKERIHGIQTTTESAVREMEEISGVVKGVSEIVSTIATAVVEQSVATKEIASNIAQASQGIQEVNVNVNQCSTFSSDIARDIAEVSQTSGEISNSTSQVSLSARQLNDVAEELGGLVGTFKV